MQLVKKFLAFHGTPRFITALTCVRQLSLSWASPIHSIYSHLTSWRSILILSTHLRLGLPSGLFPSGFPTKTLYTSLYSPIRATCPAHLILLDFITRTILGEQYKSFSSSLCNLLHSPVTTQFLIQNKIHEVPHCATLSSFLLPSTFKAHLPQHPSLEYPQLILFALCEKVKFDTQYNTRLSYNSVSRVVTLCSVMGVATFRDHLRWMNVVFPKIRIPQYG